LARFLREFRQNRLFAFRFLLERFPQILQEMKFVGDLARLRRSGACSGSVVAATIPAHPLHLGVDAQPGFGGGRGAIWKEIDGPMPRQIH
jgi:hypothetical protein